MTETAPSAGEEIELPEPRTESSQSVESAIAARRSRREFQPGPVELADVSQLLWAAQGETDAEGHRAAPSAGATYPLEVFCSVGADGVPGLDAGVYQYRPASHSLVPVAVEPVQAELRAASYDQEVVEAAPVALLIAGIEERTAQEYGARAGELYVPMEAGHVGENIHLQVESLGLATVSVGGFEDTAVAEVMEFEDERPLAIYPIGQRVD
ncbi:SagB/ThcOx family dehydrogenase [Halodesulfurarchaeum sp. HSR-GB]|uniref:SagB/ThcOx family dehydrogenase n=1 Tax=Halodesulfurarchaeum sp. HSR-GB TaxID=3074077 RepID=UPI00285BE08B|nr:SagB/ThcOx family dehydrogenase [Halodesulfurarchaeum sp. HSR-GB]MDR5655683.1 SagB/ThcOx family dehydrogenase [Halodesulfurarchaeum sp. HSR-GB]